MIGYRVLRTMLPATVVPTPRQPWKSRKHLQPAELTTRKNVQWRHRGSAPNKLARICSHRRALLVCAPPTALASGAVNALAQSPASDEFALLRDDQRPPSDRFALACGAPDGSVHAVTSTSAVSVLPFVSGPSRTAKMVIARQMMVEYNIGVAKPIWFSTAK